MTSPARFLANLLNSSGNVPDTKLVALTASKLTGQVPDANAPSGSVIQVVHGTISTEASTTSTTYSATGISLSITPSSAASKILIVSRVAVRHLGYNYGSIRWLRDGVAISAPPALIETGITTSGSDVRAVNPYILFDSPNTTSPVTYSAQFASFGGTFAVQPNSMITQTILMEISA